MPPLAEVQQYGASNMATWVRNTHGTIFYVYTGLLHLYVEIENKFLNDVPLLAEDQFTQLISISLVLAFCLIL